MANGEEIFQSSLERKKQSSIDQSSSPENDANNEISIDFFDQQAPQVN